MSKLSSGQRWVLVAFLASALMLGNTLFLQGDVRTFGYFLITIGVAAYAVITSSDRDGKADSKRQD